MSRSNSNKAAADPLNSNLISNEDHPSQWFEALYDRAQWDGTAVPWASLEPSPDLEVWLDQCQIKGYQKNALVVGCGLGDDAEALARRGFNVTAFDYSKTAIEWCHRRFPDSKVTYHVADLFDPPLAWQASFDFVLEYFTVQALPPKLNEPTIKAIAGYIAPGGTLLVICLGRDPEIKVEGPPWPLTKDILLSFQKFNLKEIAFEEYAQQPDSPIRRFRVEYRAITSTR